MILFIGLGGMLGAFARYTLGLVINQKAEKTAPFPMGTWCINLSGSFLLGLLAHWHKIGLLPETLWFLLGIGFCGAYTTFSTFGTETMQLIQTKRFSYAFSYVVLTVLFGLLFAWFGYQLLVWF